MMASTDSAAPDHSAWDAVAREKLARVLGTSQGSKLFQEVLAELGVPQLSSANDLLRFGERLEVRQGFVRALGVVLRTHALLRGAR